MFSILSTVNIVPQSCNKPRYKNFTVGTFMKSKESFRSISKQSSSPHGVVKSLFTSLTRYTFT